MRQCANAPTRMRQRAITPMRQCADAPMRQCADADAPTGAGRGAHARAGLVRQAGAHPAAARAVGGLCWRRHRGMPPAFSAHLLHLLLPSLPPSLTLPHPIHSFLNVSRSGLNYYLLNLNICNMRTFMYFIKPHPPSPSLTAPLLLASALPTPPSPPQDPHFLLPPLFLSRIPKTEHRT